ncbi:MAG: hypothetical protein AAFR84_14285 [Pseudomonadota bacterium]
MPKDVNALPGAFYVMAEPERPGPDAGGGVQCFSAESYDAESHEVDGILYTGAWVTRRDIDGQYWMRIDTAGLDLSRLTAGPNGKSAVPLAIEHMPYLDFNMTAGMVISASIDGAGRLIGRFKLHADESAAELRQRIQAGTIASLSIGIDVLERVVTVDEAGTRFVTVTQSRLKEASLVGVAADPGAGLLSAQGGDGPRSAGPTATREGHLMPPITQPTGAQGAGTTMPPAGGTPPPAPPATPPAAAAALAGTASPAAVAAGIATPAPAATPATIVSAAEFAALQATAQGHEAELATLREDKRQNDIRGMATAFGLEVTLADEWITAGLTLDQARGKAQEAFSAKQTATATPTQPHASPRSVFDNRQARLNAMVDGALLSARKITEEKACKGARDYAGLSLIGLARQSLSDAGVDTRGMGDAQVAAEVLNGHTSSDFPLATGALLDRMVRQGYEQRAPVYPAISQRMDLPNYRDHTFVSLGDMPLPTTLAENGEIRQGTFGEEGEVGRLDHRARALNVSRKMLINDSLGHFLRIPELLGRALSRLEDRVVIAVLMDNNPMRDGIALFAADHNNVAAAGSGITVQALSNAREAMRKQIGVGDEAAGDEPSIDIDLRPRFILTGPGRQTAAEQILRPIQSAKVSDVNVFENGGSDNLQPIVSNYISGAPEPWFVLSDPADGHGLMHGFLEGSGGSMIETRPAWSTTGAEFRVIHDFGAWCADFRGVYRNAGN